MMKFWGHNPEEAHKMVLGNSVPLFPAKKGSHMYLGDTAMLGNVEVIQESVHFRSLTTWYIQ
jgi:hypothetical protein